MPVDICLTEMKSGYHADVEAAELRSLLARRHVNAGHFRQVLVTAGARNPSPKLASWHELKGDQQQDSYYSSSHVRPSEKRSLAGSARRGSTSLPMPLLGSA